MGAEWLRPARRLSSAMLAICESLGTRGDGISSDPKLQPSSDGDDSDSSRRSRVRRSLSVQRVRGCFDAAASEASTGRQVLFYRQPGPYTKGTGSPNGGGKLRRSEEVFGFQKI